MSRAATRPQPGNRAKQRRPSRWRWPVLVLIGCAAIGGGLWVAVWWEERPLAEVERLLAQKDSWEAVSQADRFLKLHPGNNRATALKARALVQMGRAAEAVRLFDQVGAASKAEMKAFAEACLILERWVQALPILEYLLEQEPRDKDLLHEVSACRAKLGEFDGAVAAAARLAEIPGNEARGYLLVGMLERDRGNSRKACDAWARVLEINPAATDLQITPDEFNLGYGTALLKLGEPEAASERLQSSIATKPTGRAMSLLGKAYNQLGRSEEAEQEWLRAVERDPSNEAARQGLSELAMKKSKFQEALDWLKPLETSPMLSSASAFLMQRASTLLGDTAAASAWQVRVDEIRKLEELHSTVDQVLVDSPDSMWGRVLRGYRLAEQGNWDQAGILVTPYLAEPPHPFITELGAAIQNRSALPHLNRLPIESF